MILLDLQICLLLHPLGLPFFQTIRFRRLPVMVGFLIVFFKYVVHNSTFLLDANSSQSDFEPLSGRVRVPSETKVLPNSNKFSLHYYFACYFNFAILLF